MKKIVKIALIAIFAFSVKTNAQAPSYTAPASAGNLQPNGGNVHLGSAAGQVSNGQQNTFVGTNSGINNLDGSNNTFLGTSSGYALRSGSYNVFIGYLSGNHIGANFSPQNFNGGSYNTFVGERSGDNNIGTGNSYFGSLAGANLGDGNYNSAFGTYSSASQSGTENSAFGHGASAGGGLGLTNSKYNSAFGALSSTGSGIGNTTVGAMSGQTNLSGNYNSFFGVQSGFNSTGSYNVLLGQGTTSNTGDNNLIAGAAAASTGANNIVLGWSARSGGNNNIVLGHNSGFNISGNYNTVLGGQVITSTTPINNTVILADGQSNQRVYIHSNGNTGIGLGNNVIPQNKLEVKHGVAGNSGLRFTDLNNTSASITNTTNKVLSVNANGDVILVDDKQGSGSGGSTTITAGTNIVVTANTSGYTISSPTTNTLTNNGANTLTSTVNGVVATAPVINTVVNTVVNNQLTTTVNGVVSTPVSLPVSIDTDAQTLALNGNQLSISNGNTVTLPTFVDTDTDQQTLSITGNQLSISNGNTVNLPVANGSETIIQAGTNVTVTGNGTSGSPYVINSTANGIDTSIYTNDGTINQATTTTALNLRTVNMGNTNLFFNTANSAFNNGTKGFGRIYIGNSVNLPFITSTATNQSRYRLLVEGGILTEKVKVALRNTGNWADYVFGKNYKLMPLQEIEAFIAKNKHLPGVSSAETLVKEGLDVGEMQAKQMEKIEELTLYVIEQNKQLETQKKEIEELKVLVKSLLSTK